VDAKSIALEGFAMDFGLNQIQREIRDLSRSIFKDNVTPEKLASYDEYAMPRFDEDLWSKLAEAGLLSTCIDSDYGGSQFGFMELALLLEEVGRSIAPVPLASHCLSMMGIQKFGEEKIRKKILPEAASGKILLTSAFLEPMNNNPMSAHSTSYVFDGKNYIISGRKQAVPFANQADYILLSAANGEDLVVFIIEPGAAGVSIKPLQVTSFEPQAEICLNEVTVESSQVVVVRDGSTLVKWIFDRMLSLICMHQVGVTDAAMKMSASYTSERTQFGVPVATFQAVGHRMADSYIDIECLRLTSYQAASLLDLEEEADIELQIAKIWAADVGHRLSYSAQHVHGGAGIDRDYPLWRYCLWLRHNEMIVGGSSYHTQQLGNLIASGRGLFS
tara:strand:- start:7704 stop:8870 length:1167 start_codon:yes stop_codon:yes gene_type:complete